MSKNQVKFVFALLGFLLLSGLVVGSGATVLAMENQTVTVDGTVKSVSADGKHITLSIGSYIPDWERRFLLTSRTEITLKGKASIAQGMKVTITYDKDSKEAVAIKSEGATTEPRKTESTKKEAGNSEDKSELDVRCQELCKDISEQYKKKGAAAKPKIAVLDFSDLSDSGQITQFGKLLAEKLTTNSVKSGDFNIVERSQLEKAMVDAKLTAKGFIKDSPEAAKKLGNKLRADAVVCGTVADLGRSFEVNARLLSTETGEVLAAASAKFVKDDEIKALIADTGKPPQPKPKEETAGGNSSGQQSSDKPAGRVSGQISGNLKASDDKRYTITVSALTRDGKRLPEPEVVELVIDEDTEFEGGSFSRLPGGPGPTGYPGAPGGTKNKGLEVLRGFQFPFAVRHQRLVQIVTEKKDGKLMAKKVTIKGD